MGDVGAVAKLAQYAFEVVVEPLLATFGAKREVKANRIRAEGCAEIMEILAIGEARAELAGKAVRSSAATPRGLAPSVVDAFDARVESYLRKRVNNLERIVVQAMQALPPGQVPDVEPDMAWTSKYSEAAQNICDEEMREMWARVLAGEVASQGSTSLKTLSVLRDLDQPTARHFKRLCSLAISAVAPSPTDFDPTPGRRRIEILDHRIPFFNGNLANSPLGQFGLSNEALLLLVEHELVATTHDTKFNYGTSTVIKTPPATPPTAPIVFKYQGQMWSFVADRERDSSHPIPVHGVASTRAGRELSKVGACAETWGAGWLRVPE